MASSRPGPKGIKTTNFIDSTFEGKSEREKNKVVQDYQGITNGTRDETEHRVCKPDISTTFEADAAHIEACQVLIRHKESGTTKDEDAVIQEEMVD